MNRRIDWAHDLILPTLLFVALGGMTWAVRGCSGFGAVPGCVFAGVTWGIAWWYIARDPAQVQSRRYTSGWIVLAMTVGIGISGQRGWMQWPSFFEGRLDTNAALHEFVPISRSYGFLWLFIAGVPWAGLGACMLAWTGSQRETRPWHWLLRMTLGIGGSLIGAFLIKNYPEHFLPLYDSLKSRYHDYAANPNLRRLTGDCESAIRHLGFYLGFLSYELFRRDWKNVTLISTVGLVNGAGWSLCQNWKWAAPLWPDGHFNWWRCWESSGGLSIGLAFGIAYFLTNRPMSAHELAIRQSRPDREGRTLEWFLVYTSLAVLLAVYFGIYMGQFYLAEMIVAIIVGLAYYQYQRNLEACAAAASGQVDLSSEFDWLPTIVAAVAISGLLWVSSSMEPGGRNYLLMFYRG